ncbi:metallophosphoesterase [Oceanobacillus sp. Castelsardo]|uniref:metallophosphoesterase n=1 Tax=Oceanobacillus sp. Castelsardo TaxID=1851204 RepID=UPI000838A094|nr:metallophosphoesterase [Oceanobacillus sp. Castelsardo]
MYEVLVISDSHGLKEEITEIKNRHPNIKMIHCGDSELEYPSSELYGMYKVRGNCDFDSRYPVEEIISIGGLTFFVTHGHLFQVKSTLLKLSYRAKEIGANVICFGHSHIAGAEQIEEQLFINPGSIRLPRNRHEKTYAILKWESTDQINVQFYSLDGSEVKELIYTASFK